MQHGLLRVNGSLAGWKVMKKNTISGIVHLLLRVYRTQHPLISYTTEREHVIHNTLTHINV